MRYKQTLFTLSAAILLTGCAGLTKPSQVSQINPLVIASCPGLSPLSDDTFGATTAKLVEVANQYRDCRAAALSEVTK